MFQFILMITFLCLSFGTPEPAQASDVEFSFYEPSGTPVAYLAPAEEMTIYTWSGDPVAYLDTDEADGPHVYGFNGKHLGWFAKGLIFDKTGKVACASKEALSTTEYEPYKSYKKYKPYRAYKERSPRQPSFTAVSSSLGCLLLLANGGK